MAAVRVPVLDGAERAVYVNPDATLGAQFGVDVFGEDGEVLTLARLRQQLDRTAAADPVNPIFYESQIVDGSLLARLAADELVTGLWRYQAALTLSGGATIAGTLPVARPAGVYAALDVLSARARLAALDGTAKTWAPLDVQTTTLRVQTGTRAVATALTVAAAGAAVAKRLTVGSGLHVAGDVTTLGTASTGITAFLASTATEARLGAVQWSSGQRQPLNLEASLLELQIGRTTPATVLRLTEAEALTLQSLRSEKGIQASGVAPLPGALFQPLSFLADSTASTVRLTAYRGATAQYQPLAVRASQIDYYLGVTLPAAAQIQSTASYLALRGGHTLRLYNPANAAYETLEPTATQLRFTTSLNTRRLSFDGFQYYRFNGPIISRTGGLYIQGDPQPQFVSGKTLFMDVKQGRGRFGAYDFSASQRIPMQIEGITIRLRANGVVSFIARNDYVEIQEAKLWAHKGLAVQNAIHKISALRGVFSFLDTVTDAVGTYGRVGAYQYDVEGWRALRVMGSSIALYIDGAAKVALSSTDLQLRSNTIFRVYNSTNAKAIELAHNGVNGDINATDGDINFLCADTEQAKIRASLSTGQTSTLRIRDHANDWRDAGLAGRKEVRHNATFTLAAEDANGMAFYDASTNHTITLAASTDLDFPIGSDLVILAGGTGRIYINEGAGTTLYSVGGGTRPLATGNRNVAQGVLHIWRRSATAYYSFNERGVS